MPNRLSKFASSIKQLGEAQATEMDFIDLLNKDIRELDITDSLRRLGRIRVMEWDFRTVIPAMNKLAHQEVDLVNLVRRTAAYKVMEWDFKTALHAGAKPTPEENAGRLGPEELQELIVRLKDFLQYVVVNLIDEPGHAQIKVREIAPGVLRFRLVLVKRDVAMLIGREGHTAAAIRNLLKAAAAMTGTHVLLEIHSHDEEMVRGGDAE